MRLFFLVTIVDEQSNLNTLTAVSIHLTNDLKNKVKLTIQYYN